MLILLVCDILVGRKEKDVTGSRLWHTDAGANKPNFGFGIELYIIYAGF